MKTYLSIAAFVQSASSVRVQQELCENVFVEALQNYTSISYIQELHSLGKLLKLAHESSSTKWFNKYKGYETIDGEVVDSSRKLTKPVFQVTNDELSCVKYIMEIRGDPEVKDCVRLFNDGYLLIKCPDEGKILE